MRQSQACAGLSVEPLNINHGHPTITLWQSQARAGWPKFCAPAIQSWSSYNPILDSWNFLCGRVRHVVTAQLLAKVKAAVTSQKCSGTPARHIGNFPCACKRTPYSSWC